MNQRLSKQNLIAVYLLVFSLVLLTAGALRIDTGLGTRALVTLGALVCVHLSFLKPATAKGLMTLIVSGMALGGLDQAFMRWSDAIKILNPLQIGLSQTLSNLFALETWPSFVFYSLDAVLQGADVGTQNHIYNICILLIISGTLSFVFYKGIVSKKHYGYYLIPLVFFVYQWFQYAEHIQIRFSLYFIGFIMAAGTYTRDKAKTASEMAQHNVRHFGAKRYGFYLLLVGIAVIGVSNVLLFFMPIDALNGVLGESIPNILDMRTGYKRGSMSIFTFRQTIYEPYEGRLGGPVERGENPVLLRVWSDQAGVYLRGRVKTKYTGSSWVSEHGLYSNNNDYTKRTGTPLTPQNSYEVTVVHEGLATRTVFAPLGLKELNLDKSKVFMNPDGALYYKRDSFEGPLSVYKMRGVDYFVQMEDRDLYLQLPTEFDERIALLAQEITAGLTSDYDKMEALKNWLRQNYPYELRLGLPPLEEDFVSYFLFEEKAGYCTYFASALATMGRTINIPTRYVEGFLTPGMREPDGSYAVRADRAHAWTEAYIEGEGWRIFEATPAYSGTVGQRRDGSSDASEDLAVTAFDDESQFIRDAKEDMLDVAIGEDTAYRPEQGPDYRGQVLGLAGGLTLAILAVAAYIWRRANGYFSKGSGIVLASRLVYYLEDLIDMEDETRTPAEKLSQYLKSLGENTNTLASPYDIIDRVNDVLYSGNDVTPEALAEIEHFVFFLEKRTKGRLNRIKYWMKHRKI